MKKILLIVCLLAFAALPAQAGLLNSFSFPTAIAVSDTSTLATYDTLLSISGKGILYSCTFNNDATHDTSVIITIDGTSDTVTVADGEEQTAYILRSWVPGTTGIDNDFVSVISDSTLILGKELNLPFNSELVTKYKTAASGGAQINAIYGKD